MVSSNINENSQINCQQQQRLGDQIESISHHHHQQQLQQHRDSSSSEHQQQQQPQHREQRSGSRSWAIKRPTMGDIRRLSPPGLKDVRFFFVFVFVLIN